MWKKLKNSILDPVRNMVSYGIDYVKNIISNGVDFLFPQFCFYCKKEGSYLCQDCQSVFEVLRTHQKYSTQNLNDLYFALSYQNPMIKNLIQKFKYQPFVKELAKPLTSLMMEHFQCLENSPEFILEHFHLLDNNPNFSNFVLVPVPLDKKKLKWRGFNQTQEIGKNLSVYLNIPLISDCLIKIKETLPQTELSDEARKENIKGVFLIKNEGQISGKKILLVDDVYTTGSTMEECARVLKNAGAKEIIGIVITRD